MNALYAIRDFIIPPRCAGCRTVFAAKYGEKNWLCPECERKWELLKATICPDCGKMWSACRCAPKVLEKAGASQLVKLVPYRPKRAVSNNVVLYLKRRRDMRTFDFVSTQLARELNVFISKTGLRREDVIITYCPRRRRAKNEYGFDQAQLIAKSIAKAIEISCVPLLKRRGFFEGKAQKKLDSSKRADNVKGAFEIAKDANVKKKTVLLLDDLVTTGSTMAECARLLKNAGASLVVGVTIATTEKGEM